MSSIASDPQDDGGVEDAVVCTRYRSIEPGLKLVNSTGFDWTVNPRWFFQEKVDGSQLSFCRVPGDAEVRLYCRGHEKKEGDSTFGKAAGALQVLRDRLNPAFVYHGEFLSRPRHNVVTYGRVPTLYVVLYDVQDVSTGEFLMPGPLAEEATRVGLEAVALLYDNTGAADTALNPGVTAAALIESILAGSITSSLGGTPEGVVLKCHEHTRVVSYVNADGETVTKTLLRPIKLKFVTPSFQERNHQKTPKPKKEAPYPNPSAFLNALGAEFDTPARLAKGPQRLRDLHGLEDPATAGYTERLHADLDADLLKEHRQELVGRIRTAFERWVKIARSMRLYPQALKNADPALLADPVFQLIRATPEGEQEQLMDRHLSIVCEAARRSER